jgi:predicted metalloendopeptidase
MSIRELQQKYGFIDWNLFLRHFTPNDASVPERVIVTSPRFMQALSDWLVNSASSEDGVTTRTMLDYFTIKTILANINYLDKDTREVHRAMTSSISSGTTASPPRERVCVTATSIAFGQLLGRYFVIKSFGGEPQREQAARFMDNIQSAWSERLGKIDWLDEETRSRALEKVNKIGHKEAYSTIAPDVRSPNSLFEYYATIHADPTSYYSNQKSAKNWELVKEWNQIGKSSDKNAWYMDPHEVNAYYTPTFNEIVIPAGILQNPFYHSELPQYLNYGGIGVVIGHEITVRDISF